MHKEQKACNLIKKINKYRDGSLKDYELIKDVCDYFDDFKNETLSESDLKFLKYIASIIGVPQFYDLLKTFNPQLSIEDTFLVHRCFHHPLNIILHHWLAPFVC